MGLLTIIRKVKEKEKEIRILILGLDNAGKTTIVKKFSGERIDTISPTLGFNIQTLEYQGFKLNIWDIGGQKTIRSYWKNYFEVSSALIWCVDSADRARFSLCKNQLHELLLEEKLAGAPLLVFANKQDLSSAASLDDIHNELDLGSLSRDRNWCILECSAVTGNGLAKGIEWLVSALTFQPIPSLLNNANNANDGDADDDQNTNITHNMNDNEKSDTLVEELEEI